MQDVAEDLLGQLYTLGQNDMKLGMIMTGLMVYVRKIAGKV